MADWWQHVAMSYSWSDEEVDDSASYVIKIDEKRLAVTRANPSASSHFDAGTEPWSNLFDALGKARTVPDPI